jgi:hypothetical protein
VTEKEKAREWRRINGKEVFCLWCGKEIGDWIDCECHASKWRGVQMTEADLGLGKADAEA